MYVSFQVLSIINDYWLIHRIPVSFSGASTYNKLSRIMMLCCCTHNSLVQCNHSYMIPEYDAIYDLKKQWYYEHCRSYKPCVDIRIPFSIALLPILSSYLRYFYWNIWNISCSIHHSVQYKSVDNEWKPGNTEKLWPMRWIATSIPIYSWMLRIRFSIN